MVYKDKAYVINKEDENDSWFSGFAENWLDAAFRQDPYQIDWSGTSKGKNCVIELKTRDVPSTQYKTAFIEAYKASQLLYEYIMNGNAPFYINHWTDDVISVWNLAKLPEMPQMRRIRAYNNELHQYTETEKYELPMSQAKLYNATTLERIK